MSEKDALREVLKKLDAHVLNWSEQQAAANVIRAALAQAEAAQPVAWCSLTPSGRIEYFDGKPMVMPGPVGNEMHQTPLFAGAAPQPAEAAK